jgi:hypothetical protein
MGSRNFLKNLSGLSPQEMVVQLTFNKKEFDSAKIEIANSWAICEIMVYIDELKILFI